MISEPRNSANFDFDVSLSFAGEDREYVESFAKLLRSKGIRVFYDRYETIDLWGKDLYSHLDDIYRNAARFCVLFASEHYASKVWTNHERQSAQARALIENSEYILPVRFDNTPIPGLRPTIGYLDLQSISPEELSDMTIKKIGKEKKYNFLPPELDTLYKQLKIRSSSRKAVIYTQAYEFFSILKRMTEDERCIVFNIFMHSCVAELPDNVHVDIDLLRRYTDYPVTKIKRLLGGLSSLGFSCSIDTERRYCHSDLGGAPVLILQWRLLKQKPYGGNLTDIANAIIKCAVDKCCLECGMDSLRRLDFSLLGSITS